MPICAIFHKRQDVISDLGANMGKGREGGPKGGQPVWLDYAIEFRRRRTAKHDLYVLDAPTLEERVRILDSGSLAQIIH